MPCQPVFKSLKIFDFVDNSKNVIFLTLELQKCIAID